MKEQVSQTKKGNVLRTSMYVAVLIGLAAFLIFSILAAITFGNADLSLKDVYSVIAYKLFHIKSLSAYAEGAVHDVVWLIRLPESSGSGSWNGSFRVWRGYAGDCAEPAGKPVCAWYFIRCIAWCHMAIMLGVGSFLGGNSVGIPAFIGAMVTSFAVIAIANMGGKASSAKLILAGMAVSAVLFCFFQFCHLYHQRQKCGNRSNEVGDGKPCRSKLDQSGCNASCYVGVCGCFLDAVS